MAATYAPRDGWSRVTGAATAESGAGRLDVCRLVTALFGLTLYLGLPAAALAYLGFRLSH